MKALIASDVKCYIVDGEYYLTPQVHTIFKRYAEAFETIGLCARAVRADGAAHLKRAGFLSEFINTGSHMNALLNPAQSFMRGQKYDLIITRLPSFVGIRFAQYAQRNGIPCMAEVMGDAWAAYWNHSAAGKLIAPYVHIGTKRAVRHADYAVYVTRAYLQERYPCAGKTISASNVQLPPVKAGLLDKRMKMFERPSNGTIRLATTAAVDVLYKGQRFVIKAIPDINAAGYRVEYTLIGGGDDSRLKKLACQLNVADQVKFVGVRPHDEVFKILDAADIYIQPSLQEGLPRAVIEAMSRGCLCIGADTAGIPELLQQGFIVRRKSSKDIARCVVKVWEMDGREKSAAASYNFEEAQKYSEALLDRRRNAFFDQIKAGKQSCAGGVKLCGE